jgi:hypothetical protein
MLRAANRREPPGTAGSLDTSVRAWDFFVVAFRLGVKPRCIHKEAKLVEALTAHGDWPAVVAVAAYGTSRMTIIWLALRGTKPKDRPEILRALGPRRWRRSA